LLTNHTPQRGKEKQVAENVKEFLCVLKVTQRQGPGIIPVIKWDWSGNSNDDEKWELLACGLMIPMDGEVKSLASNRVIAPASMPEGMPDPQEVTMEDFPAKAPVIAQYSDPSEYTERTGKRFRMTKEQKERGLSRDDAFQEFVAGLDS